MSLFVDPEFIEIKVYYRISKPDKRGKTIPIIMEEPEAKDWLSDERKDRVEILTTMWEPSTWDIDTLTQEDAFGGSIRDDGGGKLFSPPRYKQSVLINCLKKWDIKEKTETGEVQDVPVNADNIGKLHPHIANNLYYKYEATRQEYTEEELGN